MAVGSSARDPADAEARSALLAAIERAEPNPPKPREATGLAKLVTDHLDFVWRSLRRFGVHEGDVDDASQRVFMIAGEKLAKIEQGRERAFLIGVASRVAAHARRGYQRRDLAEKRLSSDPRPPSLNPEELTQRLEAREMLDRVLDRMPAELRAVFVLFELEELSVDDIAELLTLPRGTAATRLRRSREVFHECVKLVAAETGEGMNHV